MSHVAYAKSTPASRASVASIDVVAELSPRPGEDVASFCCDVRATALAPKNSKGTSLEERHEKLKQEHEQLKESVRYRVHFTLHQQRTRSATVKSFGEKSMASIAGWITAQTSHAAITELVAAATGDEAIDSFIFRAAYAMLTTFLVPFVGWMLRRVPPDCSTWAGDQVQLIRVCLPMFFAWAWKDVISSALALVDHSFWPELVATMILSLAVAAAEATPCYHRARTAVREGGPGDTLHARIAVMPSHLGLAVGFAWNAVASWVPSMLQHHVETPLFIFMIQASYYAVITTLITFAEELCLRDPTKAESEAGSPLDDVLECKEVLQRMDYVGEDLARSTRDVAVEAMQFIYAWAHLDTVNALVFTYLLGCGGPSTCSYQSNFGFSLVITLLFTRLASMLKVQTRRSEWNRISSSLATRAMSLNVGWAWANYCSVAIKDAQKTSGVKPVWMYLICNSFAWVFMSIFHRKFEVERRAWDRHEKKEALANEIVLL